MMDQWLSKDVAALPFWSENAWTHSPHDIPAIQGWGKLWSTWELVGEKLHGDDKHLELVEDWSWGDKQAQEDTQARRQRWGWTVPGRADGGGLDLRAEEGREGDVGHQCGAGVVDEGINLLSLFTAGFDLENTKTCSKHYFLIDFIIIIIIIWQTSWL